MCGTAISMHTQVNNRFKISHPSLMHKGQVKNNEAKVWQNGPEGWKMNTFLKRYNSKPLILLPSRS